MQVYKHSMPFLPDFITFGKKLTPDCCSDSPKTLILIEKGIVSYFLLFVLFRYCII